MKNIYSNPAELEKLAKEKYGIPQFLMMENAALGLAKHISNCTTDNGLVAIVCGKGNNGGDGYAVARLLQSHFEIILFCIDEPTAQEAKVQYEMCQKLGIKTLYAAIPEDIRTFSKACQKAKVILDCIYGTGFHGELSNFVTKIIGIMNNSPAKKIACDIPSALYFIADETVTMQVQKLALYSDKAKASTGKIFVQNIGISEQKFEEAGAELISPCAYLIENQDINLPFRKKRASHKGTYGHTAVYCGQKSGAAILAATAAMNFGSGLTTLIKTPENQDLSQFQISPQLMISDSIPKKTTCITVGSGFTDYSNSAAENIINWFNIQTKPAAVFDAGLLTSPQFPSLLNCINKLPDSRIIITPHLGELSIFLSILKNIDSYKSFFADFSDEDIEIKSLAENPEIKIKIGHLLNKLFPQTTVIMKSANTFIANKEKCYIVANGSQSLSKGGSGDILAGMVASLLAQGYSALDAAITATEHHAFIGHSLGENHYDLTPEKILHFMLEEI